MHINQIQSVNYYGTNIGILSLSKIADIFQAKSVIIFWDKKEKEKYKSLYASLGNIILQGYSEENI